MLPPVVWFGGVVVITSASHAEGPRFEPGSNQACHFNSLVAVGPGETTTYLPTYLPYKKHLLSMCICPPTNLQMPVMNVPFHGVARGSY